MKIGPSMRYSSHFGSRSHRGKQQSRRRGYLRSLALAAFLTLLLGLVLGACGGGSSSTEEAPETSEAETASSGGGEEAAGEEAPEEEGPIKIGNITSIANLGGTFESYLSGVESYVKYVNENGGINGRQVELTVVDDAGEPAKNASAARQLTTEDDVVANVGDANLTEGGGAPILAAAGIPVLGWANAPQWVEDENFYPIVSSPALGGQCAPWIAEIMIAQGEKKVGLLSIEAPQGHEETACEELGIEAGGGETVATGYIPAELADYRPLVKQLMDGGAEAIRANVGIGEMQKVIEAGEELGFEGSYFGSQTQTELVSNLASFASKLKGRVYGVSFTLPPGSSNPEVKLAQENLPSKYRDDAYAIPGWATAKMFADAVEEVGSNPEALQKYLRSLDGYTAGGLLGPTEHSEGSGPVRCVIPMVLGATEFEPVEKTEAFHCVKKYLEVPTE